VRLEGIGTLGKIIDLIGFRIRDLLACSRCPANYVNVYSYTCINRFELIDTEEK
jgi:hypothetical protein